MILHRSRALAAVAVALLAALTVGRADGAVVTMGCADVNTSCTLQELFDGGTITIDDKLFAEFAFESAFPTPALIPPDRRAVG